MKRIKRGGGNGGEPAAPALALCQGRWRGIDKVPKRYREECLQAALKSISDKAEVSVDFPDKTYMGLFGRESSFDVKVEADEVLLRMVRAGDERREIAVHLHYYLLADILKEIGQGLTGQDFLDDSHREALGVGVAALAASLKRHVAPKPRKK